MNLILPRIYPITDVSISGLSHIEQAKRLIAGGARILQLRAKDASPREFYASAVETAAFARSHGAKLIINDRVDIALAARVDGVHLGQDDMPPEKAREILGPNAIIGYSTHSVEQAIKAIRLPVDYIAIGPIFPTQTKLNPDDVVGLNGLRAVREAIGTFPLVAIGGITAESVASVIAAGTDSVAIIGAILSDPDLIETRMHDLIDLVGSECQN